MKNNLIRANLKRYPYRKRKQRYAFIISLIFILSLMFSSNFMIFSSFSQNIDFGTINNLDDSSNYNRNVNEIEVKVIIPEINIEPKHIFNSKEYDKIGFDECDYLGKTGKPRIPIKTVKILIPHGKDIEKINVLPGEKFELKGSFTIEPAQKQIPLGSDIKPEFTMDMQLYSSEHSFPETLYETVGIYEQRGYRILVLNLYPMSYIPSTGIVSYFKEMDIQVSVVDDPQVNKLFRGLSKDQQHINSFIDNPEIMTTYSSAKRSDRVIYPSLDLPSGSYNYVIITNEALFNSVGAYTFQDLAASKNAAGIATTIVTVEEIYANYTGVDNQERIRNFIIDAYQTWGIEYVLLGGDGDGADNGGESGDFIVPGRGLYSTTEYGYTDDNIPSDLYYAGLDGNWNTDADSMWGEPGEDDLYAEVYIGRAPVDSEAELSNFIYKTLAHENSNDLYLSKALMVGEDLGWPVEGGGLYKDEVKNGSSANGYTTVGFPETYNVSTLYDMDYVWDPSELIAIMDDGVHIINHLGHSNVGYNMKLYNSDVDALTNDKYFFSYSQGCYNGAFDNRDPSEYLTVDCIAEHFTTTPHGAFACIGNSRYGFGDPYGTDGSSQYFDRQFFDAMFGENILELGKANQDSKEDNIGIIDQDAIRWCYYELNLFGDPMATIPPEQNDYAPILTDGNVDPITGTQTTQLNFSIVYSDSDNNRPSYLDVVINGTSYSMEKVDPMDDNYTNGCEYQSLIFLQPGIYDYFFECTDSKFYNATEVFTGLVITEVPNDNAPILTDGTVDPTIGVVNETYFKFSVNYSDADNNVPEYISVFINSIEYYLSKEDTDDTNYMDGCSYSYITQINQTGEFPYYFECYDGVYFNTTDTQIVKILDYISLFYDDFENGLSKWSSITGLWHLTDDSSQWSDPYHSPTHSMWFGNDATGNYETENQEFGEIISIPFSLFDAESAILEFYHWRETEGSGWDTSTVFISIDGIYWEQIYYDDTQYIGPWEKVSIDISSYKGNPSVQLRFYFDTIDDIANDYRGWLIDDVMVKIITLNEYAPILTDGNVDPTTGTQTTQMNFSVVYSDIENCPPSFIDVVINGTSYSMEEVDPMDNNYTDGCDYQSLIYLQPGTYDYFFECADSIFYNATDVFIGLVITEAPNDNAPILTDGTVAPSTGYVNITNFEFSVNYTDADNNAPEYISVFINSTEYFLSKEDPYDFNYMDGCKYVYTTTLDQKGLYSYSFECSDGIYTDYIGPYLGPEVIEIVNYTMTSDINYNWVDATSGIRCSLDGNDDASQRFQLPFNFTFYNGTFDYIDVCTNGFISFNSETEFSNKPFPTAQYPFRIAPFWDDLVSASPCNIFVRNLTSPSCVVVEWLNYYSLSGYLVGSFEVILFESGDIYFNYDYLDYTSGGYTCGLNFGLITSYYNSYQGLSNAIDDFSILFEPKPNYNAPILTEGSVDPTTGTQTTQFNFSVVYSDPENNIPFYIDVVINGTSYSMEKVDPLDDDYTDGCEYQSLIYLQPGTYDYFFECADSKFYNATDVFIGLVITEAPNDNAPILTDGTVAPSTGYANLTNFEFSVNYSDADNNAPEYISVFINSIEYSLSKEDVDDTNYMDGCLYSYSIQISQIGDLPYYFECSDGLYTNISDIQVVTVEQLETTLFDGLYINHIFQINGLDYLSSFAFSYLVDASFQTNWNLTHEGIPNIGYWDVDAQTRVMSNSGGYLYFGDGYHTPVWIFTDVLLGDNISIVVDGEGDHTFEVSNELICDLPGLGTVELWELEDLDLPGGIAWYEKSTGILLNGTFFYDGGSYNYTFNFVDTNALPTPPTWDEIPSDQTSEFGEPFSYDVNAFDASGIDHYWINDTINFIIDANGLITNVGILSIGEYFLEIRAYDPYGSYCSATIQISVQDTKIPTWDENPSDQTSEFGEPFSYDVNASDASGIDHYWINDTTQFSKDADGVIINVGDLIPGEYFLEIRAYDPYGNYCSAVIKITITSTDDMPGDDIPGFELTTLIVLLGLSILGILMYIRKRYQTISI